MSSRSPESAHLLPHLLQSVRKLMVLGKVHRLLPILIETLDSATGNHLQDVLIRKEGNLHVALGQRSLAIGQLFLWGRTCFGDGQQIQPHQSLRVCSLKPPLYEAAIGKRLLVSQQTLRISVNEALPELRAPDPKQQLLHFPRDLLQSRAVLPVRGGGNNPWNLQQEVGTTITKNSPQKATTSHASAPHL